MDSNYMDLHCLAPSASLAAGEVCKVYRKTITFANFDFSPVYDLADAIYDFEEDGVKIKNEDGRIIGFALLTLDGTVLRANCCIDYYTEERFLSQIGMLYPHVVGKLVTRPGKNDKFMNLHEKSRVFKVVVDHLVLSLKRPADPRICKIGEE